MNYLIRLTQKLRHVGLLPTIFAVFMYPFGIIRRRQYYLMLRKHSINERFTEIYKKNFWSSKESGSGEGSEVKYTQPLRFWLENKVLELNIKIFVDAPCGDFNWMKELLPKIDLHYTGLDIVPSVILKNREKYSSNKVKFEVANICCDPIPQCDLVMVRDCLFHLSYEDINKFLVNLGKTKYKYLLTTTHIVGEDFKNEDIITGDFRLIDLFSYPFCFDSNAVLDRVDDFPEGYKIPREMILIEKKFVPLTTRHY